jgi:hypothetical protein
MIAICPTCHGHVHHGSLEISDQTLDRWKGIQRDGIARGYFFIEPRKNPTLNLGSNELSGPDDGFIPFELSPRNRCTIRIVNEEILIVSLKLSTIAGAEVIRFDENYWTYGKPELIKLEHVQGHIKITTNAFAEFLPEWVVQGVRSIDPGFVPDRNFTLLDMEVVEPGLVRVQGLWVEEYTALLAISDNLYFTALTQDNIALGSFISGCSVDLAGGGSVTQKSFGIWFPDRDPEQFAVRIGFT